MSETITPRRRLFPRCPVAISVAIRNPTRHDASIEFRPGSENGSHRLRLRPRLIFSVPAGVRGLLVRRLTENSPAFPRGSPMTPRGSVTSNARRLRAVGEVRPVRRLRCNISGCGVSVAVTELLDGRCACLACMVLGGVCHLYRRCGNQSRAENI